LTKVKREKSTSTKGHYVTNAVLLPAVIEAKGLLKVTDKLIRMIQMIAERYSRKANFIGYSFREDMVSAAVMNLCNNALKFNPEKSANPFSFYTTAIHNSFLQYMADEKKHRNIRDALLIDAGSNPSFNFMNGGVDKTEEVEIKESDEIMIVDQKEMVPEDLVVDRTPDVAEVPVEATKYRHPKWAAREPGPVITYKPSEYTVDPITNKVTINPIPEPVVKNSAPKKLVKKKKAASKKAAKKSKKK
jgi:hypothetical protein